MAVNPKQLAAFARGGKSAESENVDGDAGNGAPRRGKNESEQDVPEKNGRSPEDQKMLDRAVQEIEDGESDEAIEALSLAEGYDPDADGNPPEWIDEGDEALWERAKKIVDPDNSDYDSPWAVVTHVFKQLGGSPG